MTGAADRKYLTDKIKALEQRVIDTEQGARYSNDVQRQMQARAEQAEQRVAELAEALRPLRGAGDRTMVPGSVVLSEGFFDRVIRAALAKVDVPRAE